eukprot:5915101-Prymnesium_polylepis.1
MAAARRRLDEFRRLPGHAPRVPAVSGKLQPTQAARRQVARVEQQRAARCDRDGRLIGRRRRVAAKRP